MHCFHLSAGLFYVRLIYSSSHNTCDFLTAVGYVRKEENYTKRDFQPHRYGSPAPDTADAGFNNTIERVLKYSCIFFSEIGDRNDGSG